MKKVTRNRTFTCLSPEINIGTLLLVSQESHTRSLVSIHSPLLVNRSSLTPSGSRQTPLSSLILVFHESINRKLLSSEGDSVLHGHCTIDAHKQ